MIMNVNKIYKLIGEERKDRYEMILDCIYRNFDEGDYVANKGTNVVTNIGNFKLDNNERDYIFGYFLDRGLIASINYADGYTMISLYPISKFAKYEDGQEFLFKRVWSKREAQKK